jgi:hypothetical protein
VEGACVQDLHPGADAMYILIACSACFRRAVYTVQHATLVELQGIAHAGSPEIAM